MSSRDTSRYNLHRYIFQNKKSIIGHYVNGMYAVICGYQFSPGYRNVSIGVTSHCIFQCYILHELDKIKLEQYQRDVYLDICVKSYNFQRYVSRTRQTLSDIMWHVGATILNGYRYTCSTGPLSPGTALTSICPPPCLVTAFRLPICKKWRPTVDVSITK